MTDILLQHTNDGGEVTVEGGRVALDDTPNTAAYLSLFGGNEADAGAPHTSAKQWWGNLLEQDAAFHMRSETQHVLRSLPSVLGSVQAVQDAVARDLAWMVEILGAKVDVAASIPSRHRVLISIEIVIDGEESSFSFEQAWESA